MAKAGRGRILVITKIHIQPLRDPGFVPKAVSFISSDFVGQPFAEGIILPIFRSNLWG